MELPPLLLIIHIVVVTTVKHVNCHSDNALVLLISFDGFRWDYLNLVKQAGKTTPNFDALVKNGVKSDFVEPRFTSITFPNHYSIVTGMYEDNHGVVSNQMFDPTTNDTFDVSDIDSKWFTNSTTELDAGPEPIWVTNQIEEQTLFKRRSGVFFWPGSTSKIHNELPYHNKNPYDGTIANKTRIDTVVDWFATEKDPINLGLLYFSEPDHLGHMVGPYSPRMIDMIVELDGLVGYLISKLKEHHLFEKINMIITSDHGMAEIKPESMIRLDEYLDPQLYDMYGSGTVYSIWPKEGVNNYQNVLEKLRAIAHLHVYEKESIPQEFHYKYNNRIGPIVISSEEGWEISHNTTEDHVYGAHGFNNSLPSMRPFFIAHGPVFKEGYEAGPFKNIDIYSLMCHILDIKPAPNDGNLNNVIKMLKIKYGHEQHIDYFSTTIITYFATGVICLTIGSIFCIGACRTNNSTSKRLIKTVPVQMNAISESHTHLLATTSDEEEIP